MYLCTGALFENLARPLVLGLDFLRTHKIGLQWSYTGERMSADDKCILVGSAKISISSPKICTKWQVGLLARA